MKKIILSFVILLLSFNFGYAQSQRNPCYTTNGTNCIPVSPTTPLPVTTSSSGVQDTNIKEWAGGTLGAISNYGTSPGAVLVPGFNAFVTNPVGLSASQNGIGNVGGKTVGVCVTPTVTTANAYGTNYVVGGLLTFANAFTSTGTGILQGVVVTIAHVETNGFTFVPFNSNPSNTTWTDAAVANINSADIVKQRNPVALGAYSGLGTTTIASAAGLGEALAPGTTSLYGVLIANAALTNNFTSTSEVQVCVKVLDDL